MVSSNRTRSSTSGQLDNGLSWVFLSASRVIKIFESTPQVDRFDNSVPLLFVPPFPFPFHLDILQERSVAFATGTTASSSEEEHRQARLKRVNTPHYGKQKAGVRPVHPASSPSTTLPPSTHSEVSNTRPTDSFCAARWR